MKRTPLVTIVLLVLPTLLVACSNSSDSEPQTNEPVVNLTPPDDDPGTIVGEGEGEGEGEGISHLAPLADRLAPLRGLTRFSVEEVPGTLSAVSSVLRAPEFMAVVDALYTLEQGVASGSVNMQNLPVGAGATYTRAHSCPGGGTYYATLNDADNWNGSFIFELCVIDGVFRNGSYVVETVSDHTDGSETTNAVSVSLNALGVSKLGEWVRAVQGAVVQQHIARADSTVVITQLQSLQHNEVVLVPGTVPPTVLGLLSLAQPDFVFEFAAEYMVPDLTYSQTAFADGTGSRWLRVTEESSILTIDPDLNVSISQPANELILLSDTLSGGYDSGVLELSVGGTDGNRLKLQADNGDDLTFDVTIGGALESVVSTVETWSSYSSDLFQAPDRLKVLDDLLKN